MHIGLLIYGSLETVSGGYLYDRKLVDHLQNQGDHVEIISLPWRSYPQHLLDNFSRSLLSRLRALPVDVLIQDELNHPSLAWLNSKIHASYPIVSLVHHLRGSEFRPGWQNFIYHQVERRYLDSVDGFIFNSQTTRQAVASLSAFKDRPWVIATPAGDRFTPEIKTAEIAERACQPGPLRLLFLGNLIPRKGLYTLVKALNLLERGLCNLDVVGGFDVDSAYSRNIFQQVKDSGLQEQVNFHNQLNDDALAKMMQSSHCLVVPSTYEGFGIVYLEGMGFGLPPIGTTFGAAKEIIIPGKTGYLIEPGDADGLAANLKVLSRDRKKLSALSLAAHQHFSEFPTWEESMARVRTFLYEIIDRNA